MSALWFPYPLGVSEGFAAVNLSVLLGTGTLSLTCRKRYLPKLQLL